MIQIDTKNIKTLEQFFTDQEARDDRRLIIASYRKAVKPLVSTAKTFAPHKTGKLASSIGTMELKNEVALLVGAMRPKGAHGHLNENGTVERFYYTKRNHVRKSVGKMTANNFFERAYNLTEDQITGDIATEWFDKIRKDVDKANSRMT